MQAASSEPILFDEFFIIKNYNEYNDDDPKPLGPLKVYDVELNIAIMGTLLPEMGVWKVVIYRHQDTFYTRNTLWNFITDTYPAVNDIIALDYICPPNAVEPLAGTGETPKQYLQTLKHTMHIKKPFDCTNKDLVVVIAPFMPTSFDPRLYTYYITMDSAVRCKRE